MTPANFDPYFDYTRISFESAQELSIRLRAVKHFQDRLARPNDDAQQIYENAISFLVAHEAVAEALGRLREEAHVVPVMVHVAGQRALEQSPDDPTQEAVTQRCKRCGSMLGFWREGMIFSPIDEGDETIDIDEVPWWEEGQMVAKAVGPSGMGMYGIEDGRKLEEHELECVCLNDLEG